MATRFNDSFLQIYIYKMKSQKLRHDWVFPDDIRESVVLKTVTKVTTDSEIIYDEGDIRPVRKDIVLTIEAIIAQNNNSTFDETWEYKDYSSGFIADNIVPPNGDESYHTNTPLRGGNPLNNRGRDTLAVMAFFERFLSTTGLVLDLSHYPSVASLIVPSKRVSTYTTGFLVDSFNGPKPLSIQTVPLPGGNDFKLIWKVKYSVSLLPGDENYGSELSIGKDSDYALSAETRLDIDEHGDIEITVHGTVFAANPRSLYIARKHLYTQFVQYITYISSDTIEEEAPQLFDDNDEDDQRVSAQYNGFHRKITFNVEKSGRTAKFTVVYTQIKSNSALPIGIRSMDFDQEISSSLFGTDVKQGAGFMSWRNVFSGRVSIPHRINANYVWFIIFYLLAEKNRKTRTFSKKESLPTNSKEMTTAYNAARDIGTDTAITSAIKAIPTSMRIRHKHFKREVDFTIEYLLICPLEYVMSYSCIFERCNNDYYKRFLLPRETDGSLSQVYEPAFLTSQWKRWQKSTLVEMQFDPSSPDATSGLNPDPKELKFMDNSGIDIRRMPNENDPFYQTRQPFFLNSWRNIITFQSTIIDPNEKDPDYQDNYDVEAGLLPKVPTFNMPGTSGGPINPYNTLPEEIVSNPETVGEIQYVSNQDNNAFLSQYETSPIHSEINTDLATWIVPNTYMDPRFTWVKFDEEYELRTTHPTVPTESLSPVNQDWHTEPDLYKQYVNNGTVDTPLPPDIPDPILNPAAVIDSKKASGISGYRDTPEEIASISPSRKTYAVKASRYYLTVRGQAMRVQYPISEPTVISIAGKPAVKYGDGRFLLKPMGQQGSMPLYLALWEQTYTVDTNLEREDILTSIVTTGAQHFYA